jgi:hypothetical protein
MITFSELVAAPAKTLTKPRNIFWDSFFYDVGALTDTERLEQSLAPDKEGAVIVVSPSAKNVAIRHYSSAEEMQKKEYESIEAVVVAGVGSSTVGSAALARTVADAINGEVAAIVSGYGAADLLQEAMGGWFFYGHTDRFKHQTEVTMEKVAQTSPAAAAVTGYGLQYHERMTDAGIPTQLDSGALSSILEAMPPKLRLLVGHSKGSLLIDYVLEKFVRQQKGKPHKYYDGLAIVTVSTVVALPRVFKKTRQIIGTLDWFGGMNSVPDLLRSRDDGIRPMFVEGAWHHLNTKMPFHLNLCTTLRRMRTPQ